MSNTHRHRNQPLHRPDSSAARRMQISSLPTVADKYRVSAYQQKLFQAAFIHWNETA